MENIPSDDLQVKYKKIATEYSKLRAHVQVLKKGIYDEQAKSSDFKDLLKEKEKNFRKSELEIDSLNFRNQQLTKRISVLQDELDALQLHKNAKKGRHKSQDRASSSQSEIANNLLLQEELQKKIIENAQLVSQMADKDFELSQLNLRLEDAEKQLTEIETKFKCETLKLKSLNQELLMNIETMSNSKDKSYSNQTTVSCRQNQLPSINGDFLSEAGSLMGSEDALSAEESHFNEQISKKNQQLIKLEQDNQSIRIECDLLKMENERLKMESYKEDNNSYNASSSSSKNFDSNTRNKDKHITRELSETTKANGIVTELMGQITCPFILNDEIVDREENLKVYFRDKITALVADKQKYESMTKHYCDEMDSFRSRLEFYQKEKDSSDQAVIMTQDTISRLEDELHSTSTNYEQQLSIMTEHVGNLNDKLTQQFEEIQHLKGQLSKRK